jgi:hypothetical protein
VVLRPFRCCAVIIACAHAHDCFGVVGPIRQRHRAPPALIAAVCGVPGGVAPSNLINHRGGAEARFLTFAIRTHSPRSSSSSQPRTLLLRIR